MSLILNRTEPKLGHNVIRWDFVSVLGYEAWDVGVLHLVGLRFDYESNRGWMWG